MSRNCSNIDSNIMEWFFLKKKALMRLNDIHINRVSYWLNYKKKKKKQRNKGTRRSHYFIIIIIIIVIITVMHYTL